MRFVAFASEGFENIDNYCSLCDCRWRTCVKTVLFTEETPVDHHQVPRLCRKSTRGPYKLKPGQPRGAELNRVKKHHWSPSSIRYLGNFSIGENYVQEWATPARTAATAEEFSQAIQAPSSTPPGTPYPARLIFHSDLSYSIGAAIGKQFDYMCISNIFCKRSRFKPIVDK